MVRDVTINGVRVRQDFLPLPAALVGSASGSAIVLGRCSWPEELDLAFDATGHCSPVFALNGQIEGHYGCAKFEHVVSVHGQLFRPHGAEITYHTVKPKSVAPYADFHWPLARTGEGSSALTATLIALLMGYSPVILAGVHLDDVFDHHTPSGKRLIGDYRLFRQGWVGRDAEVRGRVCSVSPQGTFLRDRYGGPSWL